MSEFFAMGGYAAFVWPAYALAAIVLGGLTVQSLMSMRWREALVDTLRGNRNRRRAGDDASAGKAT